TSMTSLYGKGQYCPPERSPLLKYVRTEKATRGPAAPNEASTRCLRLDELSRVLATSRDFAELVEAWRGWHAIATPMRNKYVRYVELANEGAREIGFEDVGALWRSAYDMRPADFEADVERSWSQVKPLYEALHCYVRAKLQEKYGSERVPAHAPI